MGRSLRVAQTAKWLAFALFLTSSNAGARPSASTGHARSTHAAANDTSDAAQTNLRARIGLTYAMQLLASKVDGDRVRGVARLEGMATVEAIAALSREAEHQASARVRLSLARALARFGDTELGRQGLFHIVEGEGASDANAPEEDEGDGEAWGGLDEPPPHGDALELPERAAAPSAVGSADDMALSPDDAPDRELAREVAALALARSQDERTALRLFGLATHPGHAQAATTRALRLSPPRHPALFQAIATRLTPSGARLLGELGDLRGLPPLLTSVASPDVMLRAASMVALADLGDTRVLPIARRELANVDVRVRASAARAIVTLGGAERVELVGQLLDDPSTLDVGLALANEVHGEPITRRLATLATDPAAARWRARAIFALGRSPDPLAARTLLGCALGTDRELAYEAALSLARSGAPNAVAMLDALSRSRAARLGVRAWVVRSLTRQERDSTLDARIADLARAANGTDRALGVFATVALTDAPVRQFLRDPDARVRRAAIMASRTRSDEATTNALYIHLGSEHDALARELIVGRQLAHGAPQVLSRTTLARCANSAVSIASLCLYALARTTSTPSPEIDGWLASVDPLARATTARGLGMATLANASGRLREAYLQELVPEVRRAVVSALTMRVHDVDASSRRDALWTAAHVDPDPVTADLATMALRHPTTAPDDAPLADAHEVAWIRVVQNDGAAKPPAYAATVIPADGLTVPIAFDDDGFALVTGLAPGGFRVVLAPRGASYEALGP